MGIEIPFCGRVLLIANVCTAHAKAFQPVESHEYKVRKMTKQAGNCAPAVRDVTSRAL
ncbi:hypothetical protein [Pseudomonas syringae]|uniref:Uncharacterized protein n=1 Tax=Pseudomonas syringae TaxID=317 RepID=A0A9Q4A0S7_PSESX|nr:hypothetical protein [Pseudomonas syringae]MCF5470724.1 hypothetical protein [Pseudomonas syringae]MCF5475924.1 hypothetical protein [Pseudomonas syringae]MCF5484772.1 hypothetical protein [Pseudomonas syringae]MCF5490683.1 hypothetical protein [Pseudomonas syringae]MCF5495289.1 hypothetical protein [Pseudomonas syringae]